MASNGCRQSVVADNQWICKAEVVQDPLHAMTRYVMQSKGPGRQQGCNALQVYAGPLKGGSRAVIMFNRHSITTQYPISNVTVTWQQLGYPSDVQATVRDLHAEKEVGRFKEAFTAGVDIHDAVMVKITPLKVQQEYEDWRPWPERHMHLGNRRNTQMHSST